MKMLLSWLFLSLLVPVVFILPSQAATPVGSVIGVQGSAQAVDAQGQSRVLQLKAEIFMKDSIRTETGARVQIMFKDDSLFSVGENSEVLIDEYVFDPDKKDENNVVIRIIRGIARIITGKATDLNPDKFTVKTGRSTIGIFACDLGFEIGPEHDSVFLIRIPSGRSIRITPVNPSSGILRSRFTDFTESGLMIQIWDGGRMKTLELTPDVLQRLGGATQPQARSTHGNRSGDQANAPLPPSPVLTPPPARDPPRQPNPNDERAFRPDTILNDLAIQDRVLSEHEVIARPATPLEDSSSTDPRPTLDPDTPRPAPLPVPPLLTGGGISAVYSGGTMLNLDELTVFHAGAGFIGPTLSDVDFIGRRFDGAGNFIDYPVLSLRNVPIARFGSTTAYEGIDTHTDPNTGGMVDNDNLGQFVRLRLPQQLMYWGTPAANFPNSRLPDNRVVNYDVLMATYPDSVSSPFLGIDQGRMQVNTKTGAYVVKTPDGKIVYGSALGLRFYGQESQGVGMEGNNPNSSAPQPDGMALAGFKDPINTSSAAETGVETFNGYAAAVSAPAGGTVRSYSSADASSDTFLGNEGRNVVRIDKDNTTLHPVSLNLNVFENPAAPSPANQIHVGDPAVSFYVSGNEFGAVHDLLGGDPRLTQTRASGTDWTWGEWDGTMDVTSGGVTQPEEVHGEFVAGNTLSAAAFQALAAGGANYSLHTPSPASSFASALIADGTMQNKINGTCLLNVNIPGGGATPNWNGQFDLGIAGSESLNLHVNNTPISPNGHLQGTPTTYTLNHGGNSYDQSTLTQGDMTGNLVGPGTGPTPITGAIGSGTFVHNNGITVNMTYGTDLAP